MITKNNLPHFINNSYVYDKSFSPNTPVVLSREELNHFSESELELELKNQEAEYVITPDQIIIEKITPFSWKK